MGESQSLLSRSPFCSRAGHFYVAYAPFLLFFFVEQRGSPSIRTALTDCLYGNQGTPILITSAPSLRLPWHLTETGPEMSILRLSVSRAPTRGRERTWCTFLHTGCGKSGVLMGFAQHKTIEQSSYGSQKRQP